MFCSKCGRQIEQSDSFCSNCGNILVERESAAEEQSVDFSKRILCSDGNCIGVIGADGLCKECKRPYKVENEEDDFDENIENLERQRQQQQKTEQKKSLRIFLLLIVAAIFILGYFGTNNNENTKFQNSDTHQSTATSNKKPSINESEINEKKAVQEAAYFSNFKNAKIQKETGSIKLTIWQPWIQHVKQSFPANLQNAILVGPSQLTVAYDEIWLTKNDDYLTESEKRQYKGQLDIIKLYWHRGQIQACTVEKLYSGNPATKVKLPYPAYKLTVINDRAYCIKKLSEN